MADTAPKKEPRRMFAIRVAPAGIAALERIAADRKKAGRTDSHVSDVARDALAEYVAKHDPLNRVSDPVPTSRSTRARRPPVR